MRVLIDSATLRALLGDCNEVADALTCLRVMHEFGDAELWASARSYLELAGDLGNLMSAEDARAVLDDVLTWLHVCSVGESEAADALAKGRGDFETCLEAVCAERIGASFIVADNEALGCLTPIPSGPPDALMNFVAERFNVRYDIVDL